MGWVKKGPRNISARSARSVRQRAHATFDQAECHRAEHCGGHPMCHRCAMARRHSFPISEISRHSNGEPACAVRCTGRTPPGRDRAHVGSAKPRTHARRHRFKCWRLSDIRQRLGLPGHISEERTHASHALIPRIGSKRPWPAASVGFTKREAGVVRVTYIITRLSPWSGTSAQAGAFVLVSSNRRCCDGPYIARAVLQVLNPQRGSRSEECWGRRVKPSMPDRWRSVSLSIDGTEPP
jgi:hypothetical protein